MRSSRDLVCVLVALAGGGTILLGGCGGVTAGGLDGGKDAGPIDAAPDQVGRSCAPLPGCTSTTTCPSDCNTCMCIDGAWACTLIACNVGRCCPADPQPGCCMQYGGWSDTGVCTTTCDGMPEPGDPAWHQVSDSHGCTTWSSQGSTGPLCGQAFDAGVDGQADAALDAGADGGLCASQVDGGQQRWCPSGTQCCPGGAVATVYCYSGTGPCPAVP